MGGRAAVSTLRSKLLELGRCVSLSERRWPTKGEGRTRKVGLVVGSEERSGQSALSSPKLLLVESIMSAGVAYVGPSAQTAYVLCAGQSPPSSRLATQGSLTDSAHLAQTVELRSSRMGPTCV